MLRGLVRSGAIGRPAALFYGRALVYLLPRREERFSKDDGSLNACLQDQTTYTRLPLDRFIAFGRGSRLIQARPSSVLLARPQTLGVTETR
jgi:hypothetical protein